ncbi:MAG: hypothetical protein Ct9H300mP1_10790 [Planctomycetaceae bacterium]|nr:MAG: hypothetical protein Ct9H300mP1_10790 [Planctomycetaceae bacterium]
MLLVGIAVFLVGVRRVAVPLVAFSSFWAPVFWIRLQEGLAGELPSRSAYPDISGPCGISCFFLHAVQGGYLPLYRHFSPGLWEIVEKGKWWRGIGQEREIKRTGA